MQEKILQELRRVVEEDCGLGLVRQPGWANTGTVYIQQGFDMLAELYYNFQGTYCTIELTGAAVEAARLPDSPPEFRSYEGKKVAWPYLKYDHRTEVTGMFGIVWSVLVAFKERE